MNVATTKAERDVYHLAGPVGMKSLKQGGTIPSVHYSPHELIKIGLMVARARHVRASQVGAHAPTS